MPKRLSGLQGQEVSIVPKAANRRRFLLRKEDREMVDEVKALQTIETLDKAGLGDAIEALASTAEIATAADVLKAAELSETEQNRAKAAFRVLGEELTKKLLAKAAPKDEGDGDGTVECGACHKSVSKEAEYCPMCGKPMKQAAKKQETDMAKDAEIRKADDGTWDLSAIPEAQRPAIEAVLKAQDAETATLKERVEKEAKERQRLEDQAEQARFVAEVKQFEHLPGVTADDFASVLRKAAKGMEAKEYAKLVEVLKGADKIAEDSALFKELGSGRLGTGDGTAYGIITAKAEELRKSDPNLSAERARARVIRQHPELYKQHQDELDQLKRTQR